MTQQTNNLHFLELMRKASSKEYPENLMINEHEDNPENDYEVEADLLEG